MRAMVGVALALLLTAGGLVAVPTTSALAAATDTVAVTPAPGPIADGFRGQAYPVPDGRSAPPHVNDVAVSVPASGTAATVWLPAGKPVAIRGRGSDPDTVRVRTPQGIGTAPRADFWVMPPFLAFRDMQVTVDGRTTALAKSRVRYHRTTPAFFDDPATPGYDGTTYSENRDFLACKRDTWGMGAQSLAVDSVEQGVDSGNKQLVDMGIKPVDWGVAVPIAPDAIHQLHRDCDGKTVADHGYTHHTTQWLESLSRAVYLLAASPWAGEYRPKIDEYRARVMEIAALETKPANWKFWVSQIPDEFGHDFTHRTFMMAAALGMASTLTTDPHQADEWRAKAALIAHRGVHNQLPNGVDPERGGYDVLYQMYGAWLAELYLGTLGSASPWRDTVVRTIDRAARWMQTRIEPDGQINARGTTRVCVETVWSKGAPYPTIDPTEAIRAFLLWGSLTKDERFTATALRMDSGQKKLGNTCPRNTHTKPEQPTKAVRDRAIQEQKRKDAQQHDQGN